MPVPEAVRVRTVLQSALTRVENVRRKIVGTNATELDMAQRDLSVVITMFRNCDRFSGLGEKTETDGE